METRKDENYDYEKIGDYIRETRKKEKSRASLISILIFPIFFIPKRVRTAWGMHYKESNKITFTSEICGIIGLCVSLVIFLYTEKISSQQNEMERLERSKEINSILDNSMLHNILLIKGQDKYEKSEYKDFLDEIIKAEHTFYQWVAVADIIDEIDNSLEIKDLNEARKYAAVLKDFISMHDRLGTEVTGVLVSMVNFSRDHDPIIQNLEESFIYNMTEINKVAVDNEGQQMEMEKIKEKIKRWNDKASLKENIKILNEIIILLKEGNFMSSQIRFYRKIINGFNIVLTQTVLLPNNTVK